MVITISECLELIFLVAGEQRKTRIVEGQYLDGCDDGNESPKVLLK